MLEPSELSLALSLYPSSPSLVTTTITAIPLLLAFLLSLLLNASARLAPQNSAKSPLLPASPLPLESNLDDHLISFFISFSFLLLLPFCFCFLLLFITTMTTFNDPDTGQRSTSS